MQARLACCNHAMREHRRCYTFHVIRDGIGTPGDCCICLGSTIESKSASWAHAQVDTTVPAGCTHQFDDIAFNAGFDAHPANHLLQFLQAIPAYHWLKFQQWL